MTQEYIIYADESCKTGKKFSNFYGGALVRSRDLEKVNAVLNQAKEKVCLFKEIKWTKVTAAYLQKYIHVMNQFFDLIAQDKVKIRIMFTDNRHVPQGLTRDHLEHEYFILYYEFIKHAFGLKYSNSGNTPIRCRLYFDVLPDTREKVVKFKGYLSGLTKAFRGKIFIDTNQIAEMKSHDHVVLQCLDVVLGSMQFRLNDKHKRKLPGKSRRGKRTIAKEKLYRHILHRIRELRPHFNIGISTGKDGAMENLWLHPYRHWLFVPQNRKYTPRK